MAPPRENNASPTRAEASGESLIFLAARPATRSLQRHPLKPSAWHVIGSLLRSSAIYISSLSTANGQDSPDKRIMEYYVYVYIDPRNNEEFYYGKGKGSRKNAHLNSNSDTEKAKRITAIHKEGLKPLIRVVARDLTNDEALLVEKTLLWKLGKSLTNISPGHYAKNFRPHDKLHVELSGFDYRPGVYYYNVGQGPHRTWVDFKKYKYISAGGGRKQWRNAMLQFNKGDIFAAYLKGSGYVGIGRITESAKPLRDVKLMGKPMASYQFTAPKILEHIDSDKCEYVALVEWISVVPANAAKSVRGKGLYTTTHVRASLDNQPKTRTFLEEKFNVKFASPAR